ncbi:MAG: hypothetical protein ACLQVN_04355 [Bryobacteraceae bacterium]
MIVRRGTAAEAAGALSLGDLRGERGGHGGAPWRDESSLSPPRPMARRQAWFAGDAPERDRVGLPAAPHDAALARGRDGRAKFANGQSSQQSI